MKIRCIDNKKKVNYPKWEVVLRNQNILKDNIPFAWKNKKVLYLAITAFIMNQTELAAVTDSVSNNKTILDKNQSEALESGNSYDSIYFDKPHVEIAPVFIHGEGMGSGGCVSTAPAVFISENEALSIIEDEFRKSGIEFNRRNVPTELKYNVRRRKYNSSLKSTEDYLSETNAILNLYNTELNLGIQYFGKKTSDIFNDFDGDYWESASVWRFEARKTAKQARDLMESYGKINFGVFYDPVFQDEKKIMKGIFEERIKNGMIDKEKYQNDKSYKIEIDKNMRSEIKTRLKQSSRELLKQQINDFLEWYKYNSNN